MFAATAGMLIVALAVPGAFGENALEFAVAYTFVRAMHIGLRAATTPDPEVRRAIVRLAPTSFIGCALLFVASFTDGTVQGALWRRPLSSTTRAAGAAAAPATGSTRRTSWSATG